MRRRTTHHQDEQQHRERLLRPPDRTFRQKLRDVFWNPQNKTCLTRTPLNWFTITVYYIIFLTCVLLIFVGAMFLVYFKLNSDIPQYILNESPVGSAPCLNYFPMTQSRSLLWLSAKRSIDEYVNEIEKTFADYKNTNSAFNETGFGKCSKAPFGYDTFTPCIFLRINRMIKWKPTPYEEGDTLPSDMPSTIVDEIKKNSTNPLVWIYCEGTSAKDRDHISPDTFNFQGPKGFDTSNFPFLRQTDYVDPIVALMIKDLPTKILLSFSCSAWSKGVDSKLSRVDVNIYVE